MSVTPAGVQSLELEHAIGLSNLPGSMHGVGGTKFVFPMGASVAIGDTLDPHAQTFVRGHQGPLSCLRVSPDGRQLVTGEFNANSDICIWDVQSLQVIHRIADQSRGVVALDFSSDSTLLAAVGRDLRLAIYDTSNGGIVTHTMLTAPGLVGSPDLVRDLAFCCRVQDVKRRETASVHLCVSLVDAVLAFHLNPFQASITPVKLNLNTFLRKYTCIQYATFGDFLFIGSEAGDVAAVNMTTGAICSTVKVCSGGIRSLRLNPAADADQQSQMGTLQQPPDVTAAFRYARFGPGAERHSDLFASGGDGTVARLTMPEHSAPALAVAARTSIGGLAPPGSHGDAVANIATVNGGAVVATSVAGSTFLLDFSGAAASALCTVPSQTRGAAGSQLAPPPPGVLCIADALTCKTTVIGTHPTQHHVFVTGSQDGVLRQWDLSTYRVTGGYENPKARIAAPGGQATPFATTVQPTSGVPGATSPNKGGGSTSNAAGLPSVCTAFTISDGLEVLLSTWSDGTVRCHDMTNLKFLWLHANCHRTALTSLSVSPTMKYFVTGAAEGDIRVWDIRSREMKMALHDQKQDIVKMCLLKDDRHMVSASRDRTVATWDLGTGKRLCSHETHVGPLTDMVLGLTDSTFITSGLDHTIALWDMRHKDPARIVNYGTDGHCLCLATSNDGRLLATGGSNEVVRLWDWRKLEPVATGTAHSQAIERLAFTGDSRQLLSAAGDSAVMVWNVYG